MNNEPRVKLLNVSIGYKWRRKKSVLVSGINAEINKGEFICLLGPNGVGKSTLLKAISGVLPSIEGTIYISGKDISSLKRAQLSRLLSLVLTDRTTIAGLTCREVIELGRAPYTNWSGNLTQQDRAVVSQAIKLTNTENLAERDIAVLSDGERQRVMIARAIAQETQFIILDEPTAFLDAIHRIEILTLLKDLSETTQHSILVSTHDIELALKLSDKIWFIDQEKNFYSGLPEQLVLQGLITRVFSNNRMAFDAISYGLVVRKNDGNFRGKVLLQAEGLVCICTKRLLERVGFQVVLENEDTPCGDGLKIRIREQANHYLWEISSDGEQTSEHNSLESLMNKLLIYLL